jgi:hypothetical protein
MTMGSNRRLPAGLHDRGFPTDLESQPKTSFLDKKKSIVLYHFFYGTGQVIHPLQGFQSGG